VRSRSGRRALMRRWGCPAAGDNAFLHRTAAVVCSVSSARRVAFLLSSASLRRSGRGAMVITYVNPAIAVLAGVVLLAEPFTFGTALGWSDLAGSWLATGADRAATSEAQDRLCLPTWQSQPLTTLDSPRIASGRNGLRRTRERVPERRAKGITFGAPRSDPVAAPQAAKRATMKPRSDRMG